MCSNTVVLYLALLLHSQFLNGPPGLPVFVVRFVLNLQKSTENSCLWTFYWQTLWIWKATVKQLQWTYVFICWQSSKDIRWVQIIYWWALWEYRSVSQSYSSKRKTKKVTEELKDPWPVYKPSGDHTHLAYFFGDKLSQEFVILYNESITDSS